MAEQIDHIQYKIVLWGPKGSGKTSLIYAFGDTINNKYASLNDEFSYDLLDPQTNGKTYALPPSMVADIRDGTQKSTVINRIFHRSLRNDLRLPQWKKNQLEMSCFSHEISYYDDSGGRLIELVHRDAIASDPVLESVWVRFKNAKNVAILLDPSLLDQEEIESDSEAPRYSREAYLGFTHKLCQKMAGEQSIYRRLAVCLTKADLLDPGKVARALGSDSKDATWELIADVFGEDMREMLKNLSNLKFKVEPFVVSAKKARVNAWDPKGVEYPFFWMIEETEREYLSQRFDTSPKIAKVMRKAMQVFIDVVYVRYPKK